MATFTFYIVLFLSAPYLARGSALLQRQYGDSSYSLCARGCFEPDVDATGCPFDASGTRNACLCTSNSFLTNFMACTFKQCTGDGLATAAKLLVLNCEETNTPAIYSVDELVNIGQVLSSSGTETVPSSTVEIPSPTQSTFSTSPTSTSTTSIISTTSAPSSNTASGSASSPTTSTAPSSPSSGTQGGSGGGSSSGGSSGNGSGISLSTDSIIGIASGAVGAIGVIAAIIFGIRQWYTRAPGDRAVRDVGSWFCGCGRSHRRDQVGMGQYPRPHRYP